MRLSERMWAEWLGGAYNAADWRRGAEDLEAELEAERLRAQDLTARCDRLRHWHDAFRELADALDLPSHLSATEVVEEAKTRRADLQEEWEAMLYAERCAQEDAAKGREGVAILTLVYEMREHALRRERDAYEALLAKKVTHLVRRSDGKRLYHDIDEDIHSTGGAWVFGEDVARANEERNARRVSVRDLNRRAQAAESRATKLGREVATLRVRLAGAIAKIPPGELWRTPDPVVDAPAALRVGNAVIRDLADPALLGDMREAAYYRRLRDDTIPPVALEASDVRVQRANALAARLLESGPDFEDCRWCHGTKQSRNAWAIMCAECNGTGRQRRIKEAALEATSGGNRQAEAAGVLADLYERAGDPPCTVLAGGLDAEHALEPMTTCPTHETASGFCSLDCPDRVPNPRYPGYRLARRRVTERAEEDVQPSILDQWALPDMPTWAGKVGFAAIAERDARIATLEAYLADMRKEHTEAQHYALDLIARAERAEAVIERARSWALYVADDSEDVLEILDGKEGA